MISKTGAQVGTVIPTGGVWGPTHSYPVNKVSRGPCWFMELLHIRSTSMWFFICLAKEQMSLLPMSCSPNTVSIVTPNTEGGEFNDTDKDRPSGSLYISDWGTNSRILFILRFHSSHGMAKHFQISMCRLKIFTQTSPEQTFQLADLC